MFDILIMLAVAHQPPDLTADARYPLVRIADAREFGMTHEAAWSMLDISRQHQRHYAPYLMTYFLPCEYRRWEREANRHEEVWSQLCLVLSDEDHWFQFEIADPREWRLMQLNELRKMLGDEAYAARRMPEPTPSWMFVK